MCWTPKPKGTLWTLTKAQTKTSKTLLNHLVCHLRRQLKQNHPISILAQASNHIVIPSHQHLHLRIPITITTVTISLLFNPWVLWITTIIISSSNSKVAVVAIIISLWATISTIILRISLRFYNNPPQQQQEQHPLSNSSSNFCNNPPQRQFSPPWRHSSNLQQIPTLTPQLLLISIWIIINSSRFLLLMVLHCSIRPIQHCTLTITTTTMRV